MNPIEQQTSIPPSTNTSDKKRPGAIIAIVAVVLILIISTIYMFASQLNNQEQASTDMATDDSAYDTSQLPPVEPIDSTSDDLTSIEADLETSVDGLDEFNF